MLAISLLENNHGLDVLQRALPADSRLWETEPAGPSTCPSGSRAGPSSPPLAGREFDLGSQLFVPGLNVNLSLPNVLGNGHF